MTHGDSLLPPTFARVWCAIVFACTVIILDQCNPSCSPALAQAPAASAATTPTPVDLSIPEWRLMPAPGVSGGALACFTQEETRQILRVQEQARYSLGLATLHAQLEVRLQQMIAELEAAQREYAALRAVISERNERLSEEVLAAQTQTERYRTRLERRRIWPWVALGLGAVAGLSLGLGVH